MNSGLPTLVSSVRKFLTGPASWAIGKLRMHICSHSLCAMVADWSHLIKESPSKQSLVLNPSTSSVSLTRKLNEQRLFPLLLTACVHLPILALSPVVPPIRSLIFLFNTPLGDQFLGELPTQVNRRSDNLITIYIYSIIAFRQGKAPDHDLRFASSIGYLSLHILSLNRHRLKPKCPSPLLF